MQAAGGMAGMAKAAYDGHFAVDPGTGEQLMMSLEQMREELDSVRASAGRLDRETPLGEMLEARAVSKLNQQVASGDEQSLLHVLEQFKTSLDQAIDAVRQGMANYQQVDTEMREAYERGLQERQQRRTGGGTVFV
jgi:alpha-D-ribose 1-methylphosphonate 5-triphosphate synthase subunit PhnG